MAWQQAIFDSMFTKFRDAMAPPMSQLVKKHS